MRRNRSQSSVGRARRLSRRGVLRGLGATVALPWLESACVLAEGTRTATTKPAPGGPKRFACLFFGDGIHPAQWWAKGRGSDLELGPAFTSLAPWKQKINFIDGLRHPSSVVGGHARGAAGILTGIQPKGGREVRAAKSLDQVLAETIGAETPIPSLALACERPVAGFHESGYSMLYASHVSWSSERAPVPTELYPSLAFDSLFETRGNRTQLSVLDHVLEQLHGVNRRVSSADRAKIDEYATSVREVEKRLARLSRETAETSDGAATPRGQRPADGLPTRLDEHARLMSDVLALAFQTDRTRIATMLLTNNLSGQIYPFLGLRDDHHSFSHGWKGEAYASITRFWVEQYAYLVGKLASMSEGESSVLDNSCILLANEQWTAHNAPKVPLLMAGGLGGSFETGRALEFEPSKERKLSSLFLSIADRMGRPLERFGDADEQLRGI